MNYYFFHCMPLHVCPGDFFFFSFFFFFFFFFFFDSRLANSLGKKTVLFLSSVCSVLIVMPLF